MRSILTTALARDLESQPAPLADLIGRAPNRTQTLEQLVASCVRDAFGDASTAAQLLQERVQGNRRAFKELTQPLLASACLQAVSARIGANRPPEDDWSKDEYEETDTSDRLHALANALLDFRLPSKTILRDAFRHDVREAATTYRRRASMSLVRAAWLDAISARLPRNRTVGEVFDEARLRLLFNEAQENHE